MQVIHEGFHLILLAFSRGTPLDGDELSGCHVRLGIGILTDAISGVPELLELLRSAFAGAARDGRFLESRSIWKSVSSMSSGVVMEYETYLPPGGRWGQRELQRRAAEGEW